MNVCAKIILHTPATFTACLTKPRQSANRCSLKDKHSNIYTSLEEEFTNSEFGFFVSHRVRFQLQEDRECINFVSACQTSY